MNIREIFDKELCIDCIMNIRPSFDIEFVLMCFNYFSNCVLNVFLGTGALPPDGMCVLGVTMTDLFCGDDDIFTGGLASLTHYAGVFSFFRCVLFSYLGVSPHLDPAPYHLHPAPYTLHPAPTPAGLLSVSPTSPLLSPAFSSVLSPSMRDWCL
jgi:hypothetical protein